MIDISDIKELEECDETELVIEEEQQQHSCYDCKSEFLAQHQNWY